MENRKDIHMDLSSIESINNLDTARMSLRWALERLHALEKAKEELSAKSDKETALRERSESEYKALKRSFDLRVEEDQQRDQYYAKMEEFIALQAQGKLDALSLAKREVEVARLEESLKARRIHLEKEHAAKREAITQEQPRLKAEIQREAHARVAKQEENLALRRELLESEYAAKHEDLLAREKWFRQQERALEERQKTFDAFSAEQTAAFARDMKNFQSALEEQTTTRIQSTERLLNERFAAKEAAWDKERMLLLQELSDWRRKAEERQPRILELEKRLSEAEETARYAAKIPLLEAEMQNKLSAWLKREEDLERRLSELQQIKDQLAAAEATSRGALAAAAADAERRNKIVQEKTQAFLDKKHELEKKIADLNAQRDELETKSAQQLARMQEFEKREARREAQIKEKEQSLLKLERELEWENANMRGALSSWEEKYQRQTERARELEKEIAQIKESSSTSVQAALERGDEIQRLQKQLAERDSRAANLEKKLFDAEETARRANEAAAQKSHSAENTGQILEQSKQEFLKREQFLERQLALGQEELSRKEKNLQEQIARALALEKQNKQAFLKREQALELQLADQASRLVELEKKIESMIGLERQTAALRDDLSLKDKQLQDQAALLEQAQAAARQASVPAPNPQESARIAELEKSLARETERRKKLEAFLASRLGPTEGGSPPSVT